MDHPFFAEQYGPLDAVFQFTDVSGPVIIHEHVNGGRRKTADILTVLLGVFFEEMIRQQQHIGLTLPQRGHIDRKHVEPVIQIAAKRPILYGLFQILVGGRYDPYVGLDGLVSADPFEFFLLQHPQQADLDIQTDGTDFIQKNGSLVGQFELALFLFDGAGKSPQFMAEQFALDQV